MMLKAKKCSNLADEAVWSEPFSAGNSLINRELARFGLPEGVKLRQKPSITGG
jgi:hypothetical protein